MKPKSRIFYRQLVISVLGPRGAPRPQVRIVQKILRENLHLLLVDIKKVKPQAKGFTFRVSE